MRATLQRNSPPRPKHLASIRAFERAEMRKYKSRAKKTSWNVRAVECGQGCEPASGNATQQKPRPLLISRRLFEALMKRLQELLQDIPR